MNIIRFIGDVHAQFNTYAEMIKCDYPTIQVGDFGIGFGIDPPQLKTKDVFIRGNHDYPKLCRQHPNYVGDICIEDKMFFISGAWSIDRNYRTAGLDWWPDEQLSYQTLNTTINLYEMVKPRIMVTHDCPHSIAKVLFPKYTIYPTATSEALDAMFELHKPKIHVFGHWHINIDQVISGTRFVCVAANDFRDIDVS